MVKDNYIVLTFLILLCFTASCQKDSKKIKTKHFEINATDDWKYEEIPLLDGQLYNGFLYSENALIRISAGANPLKLTPKDYYKEYKVQILSESSKNFQKFELIKEDDNIEFLGKKAVVFMTEATHQSTIMQNVSLIFPNENHMILVTYSYTDITYFDTLLNMVESLKFY